MRAALALGLRLACGGSRARVILVGVGNALGALVVIVALGVAATVSRFGGTADWTAQVFAAAVLAFLLMPVAVLLVSVARLSAARRDRNLASLRELGLSPARTRLVCAAEGLVLCIPGAAVGTSAGALAAPVLVSRISAAMSPRPAGNLVVASRPGLSSLALAFGGVLLLAVGASLVTTRTLRTAAPSARSQGIDRRPSVWRIVPAACGAVVLGGLLLSVWPGRPVVASSAFLAGCVLLGLGLPLLVPLLVWAAASAARRLGAGTSAWLAARRLASSPSATLRIVAGLVLAVFVATGALGVVAAFKQEPSYRSEVAIVHGARQVVRLQFDGRPSGALVRQLERTPGVQAVVSYYEAMTSCPTATDAAGVTRSSADECAAVFIGSCRALLEVSGVHACAESAPVWVSYSGHREHGSAPVTVDLGRGRTVRLATSGQMMRGYDWTSPSDFTDQYVDLFVPQTLPALRNQHLGQAAYSAIMTGGSPAQKRVTAVLAGHGTAQFLPLDDMMLFDGYQRLAWLLTGVVLAIGLATFLLTSIDHAMARRREVAAQLALGTPMPVLRASQLIQVMTPLVMGILLASAGGLLGGSAYLALVSEDATASRFRGLPLAAVGAVLVVGVLGSLAVGLATLPTLGRRLDPSLLRRE